MKVYGIDIIKGSVRSRSRRPMYALVRMQDQEVLSETEISSFRLERILSLEQPEILAVDSLQEISVDQHDLFAFLQAMPPSVRLVQVTGGERKESLGKVAARFNISFNRFDPFAEARTIAKVASLGAGYEVIAFENTSEIVVSRHRSPGKGGWSQNRYIRKIHGAVQQKAREIEMELVAAGLRYEKKETRAFGGCSRVSFQVLSPRDELPIPTYRGSDVQVRISGKKLDRIRFRPLSGKPDYLIVGIDPGTTTAIAALDLEGNLLHLSSSRQMSMSDVTEVLYKIGKPLIIASDVHEMPYSVEKIRRAFNGVAYTPRQDMSVETKLELASPHPYRNDHERDALSAALDAYRSYKNKFQSILKRVPPGYDLDEVRAAIVRGLSVEQAIGEIRGRETPVVTATPQVTVQSPGDERIRILDGTVKRLRSLVKELQEESKQKDREIIRLQGRLKRIRSQREDKIRKENEIVKRDAIITSLKKRVRREERVNRNLRKRVSRLKEFESLQQQENASPMKILASFSREGVKSLIEEFGLREGELVYIARIDGWSTSVVRDLAGTGILGLVVGDEESIPGDPRFMAPFHEYNLPLLKGEDVDARVKGKQGSADKKLVEDALSDWEERQKTYELEKKAKMLEHIFKEYRSERGKEMKKVG
jgi:predicted RNase H-like nuclease (RuvC/YqgF family)